MAILVASEQYDNSDDNGDSRFALRLLAPSSGDGIVVAIIVEAMLGFFTGVRITKGENERDLISR
jgi:hypothetical protein